MKRLAKVIRRVNFHVELNQMQSLCMYVFLALHVWNLVNLFAK